MYRARRRRLLLGVVVVLFLAYTAGQLLNDTGRVRMPTARTRTDHRRTSMSAVTWPLQGQAALVLGNGRPAASPDQQPVPIASVAKVMTAYLVLKRYPLSGAQDGFTFTVTEAEVQDEAQDASENQSRVAVAAGEQLTERQLLEALLIPSGNNIAWILAAQVAGGDTGFVAEMNAEARALGMDHTTYTDPSGFDPGTVSTAADQLRVLHQAMRFAVFRQIVSMPSVTLPVAGTITNLNPLITEGYAGKTGSDSAAGGCLAFFTDVSVGGRRETAVGVVLGQGQGSNTQAILAAAGKAAHELVDSVAPAAGGPMIASPGVGPSNQDGSRSYSLPALRARTDVNAHTTNRSHMTRNMTGKRRPPSVLALIAVIGVIGACGSAALAGIGHGNRADDTDAVKHEQAVAVADARVARPAAPAGSLPSPSAASPSMRYRSLSSRSSAPSPTGTLPSPAHASLPATRGTAGGSISANSPAGSLPRPAVGAPRSSASASAPSASGTLPSTARSVLRSTIGTATGSPGAPARGLRVR